MLKENLPVKKLDMDDYLYGITCARYGAMVLADYLAKQGDDAFTTALLSKFFHQEEVVEYFNRSSQ